LGICIVAYGIYGAFYAITQVYLAWANPHLHAAVIMLINFPSDTVP